MHNIDNRNYESHHLRKYSLRVHIMLVPKYRKPLFKSKQCIFETCQQNRWTIDAMEADADHLHLLISYDCTDRVCDIVKALKQESTHFLKSRHEQYLKTYYWGTNSIWTHGYFACSTGEISTEVIREYIEKQG